MGYLSETETKARSPLTSNGIKGLLRACRLASLLSLGVAVTPLMAKPADHSVPSGAMETGSETQFQNDEPSQQRLEVFTAPPPPSKRPEPPEVPAPSSPDKRPEIGQLTARMERARNAARASLDRLAALMFASGGSDTSSVPAFYRDAVRPYSDCLTQEVLRRSPEVRPGDFFILANAADAVCEKESLLLKEVAERGARRVVEHDGSIDEAKHKLLASNLVSGAKQYAQLTAVAAAARHIESHIAPQSADPIRQDEIQLLRPGA